MARQRSGYWLLLPQSRYVLLLILVLTMNGCSSSDANQGSWNLDEVSPALSAGQPTQAETLPSVSFDGSEVTGNSGCNNFSGHFTTDDSMLEFRDVFHELKGCDPASNAFDEVFDSFFESEVSVVTEGDRMIWTNDLGQMFFIRASN